MLPLQILPAGGPLPNQQLWHSAPFNLEANIITAVTNERDRLFNIPGTPLPAFANEINRNMASVNNTRQYHNESQLRWNLSQHQAGVPLQHRVPLNNIINKTDLIYMGYNYNHNFDIIAPNARGDATRTPNVFTQGGIGRNVEAKVRVARSVSESDIPYLFMKDPQRPPNMSLRSWIRTRSPYSNRMRRQIRTLGGELLVNHDFITQEELDEEPPRMVDEEYSD